MKGVETRVSTRHSIVADPRCRPPRRSRQVTRHRSSQSHTRAATSDGPCRRSCMVQQASPPLKEIEKCIFFIYRSIQSTGPLKALYTSPLPDLSKLDTFLDKYPYTNAPCLRSRQVQRASPSLKEMPHVTTYCLC